MDGHVCENVYGKPLAFKQQGAFPTHALVCVHVYLLITVQLLLLLRVAHCEALKLVQREILIRAFLYSGEDRKHASPMIT